MLQIKSYLRSEGFLLDPMRHAATMKAEEFCNLCITLINQCIFMLRKLIETQQRQFLAEGGIREAMYRARTAARDRRDNKS